MPVYEVRAEYTAYVYGKDRKDACDAADFNLSEITQGDPELSVFEVKPWKGITPNADELPFNTEDLDIPGLEGDDPTVGDIVKWEINKAAAAEAASKQLVIPAVGTEHKCGAAVCCNNPDCAERKAGGNDA